MNGFDPATLLVPAGILGGVGLVFGTLIAVAHRFFHVWEDPRIDAVTDMLPSKWRTSIRTASDPNMYSTSEPSSTKRWVGATVISCCSPK